MSGANLAKWRELLAHGGRFVSKNRLSVRCLSGGAVFSGKSRDNCFFLPRRILTFSTSTSGVKKSENPPPPYGIYGPPIHIHSDHEARVLVHFLQTSERETLRRVLEEYSVPTPETTVSTETTAPVTSEQLKSLFLVNALPFVGFGFLDNMIMIIAGEYIDATLGVIFGMSTMAAAGIGNLISDMCGVGLAHYVEIGVSKVGVRPPGLTSAQWDAKGVRRTANLGKVLGLALGCVIGMFPLLFYTRETKKEE